MESKDFEQFNAKLATERDFESVAYAVAERYRFLGESREERLIRLDFDAERRLIAEELLAVGRVDIRSVDAARVYRGAILSQAEEILLVYSRPERFPRIRRKEWKSGLQLSVNGGLMDIGLMGFVVLGDRGRYQSVGCLFAASKVDKGVRFSHFQPPETHEFWAISISLNSAPKGRVGVYSLRAHES